MMAHSIFSETKITFSMVSLQFISFLHNQDHFQHGCHPNQDHNSMVHSNSTLIRSQQCVYQLKTSENNKWVCPSRSQETDWRSNDVFCDVTPLRITKYPKCVTSLPRIVTFKIWANLHNFSHFRVDSSNSTSIYFFNHHQTSPKLKK